MVDRLYERTMVQHGDRKVPAQIVRCGVNGCTETLHFIDAGRSAMPPEVIARKLREAKWKSGHNPRRDRCPAHNGKGKDMGREPQGFDIGVEDRLPQHGHTALPARTREVHATHTVAKGGEVTLRQQVANLPHIVEQDMRAMDRDDKRLIYGELDTLYLDSKQGYKPGASDAGIAESLGVPVIWVRSVREEMFGPADGDKRTKQVQELRARLDALNPRISEVTKTVTALMDEAQAIHLTLKTLERKE